MMTQIQVARQGINPKDKYREAFHNLFSNYEFLGNKYY